MIASKLTAATPVIVGNGGDGTFAMTWGEFLDANADGIEAGMVDVEAIEALWGNVSTATYHGGGGASAEWTIRRA